MSATILGYICIFMGCMFGLAEESIPFAIFYAAGAMILAQRENANAG